MLNFDLQINNSSSYTRWFFNLPVGLDRSSILIKFFYMEIISYGDILSLVNSSLIMQKIVQSANSSFTCTFFFDLQIKHFFNLQIICCSAINFWSIVFFCLQIIPWSVGNFSIWRWNASLICRLNLLDLNIVIRYADDSSPCKRNTSSICR